MIDIHYCPGCGSKVSLEVGESPSELALKIARLVRCTICIDELDVQEQERRLAHDANRYMERVQHSGLPLALRDLTWGTMRLENGRDEVILDAQRWSKEGGSLFLFGRPGPGKTRLAATAFTAALELRSGSWVNVPTLFTQASADFRSDDRQRAEKVLLGSQMIVLDDLGKESTSEQNKQWLMTAIENRIENLIPILITSNFTAAELGGKWGDWLASRLGAMRQWNLPGPDMRITE